MTGKITVTYQGFIAIITLNQPKRLNALSQQLYCYLADCLRDIEKREDIYVTVLTGSGRFFSAEYREFSFNELTVDGTRGVDVHSTAPGSTLASHDRQQILHGLIDTNVDVTRAFYNHSKILVVALNGPVIGLSTSLVSLVDFVYAAPHAFLLTPFSSLGLVAEGGASRSLVERLGMSKANEALLMSKRISCEELLQVGFVSKVLKPESGKIDDSAGFLKKVIQEVMESLGSHLNHRSVLKIKELIRRPEREVLDRHVLTETYLGLERFMEGAPQQEFRKLSAGQKKHKL